MIRSAKFRIRISIKAQSPKLNVHLGRLHRAGGRSFLGTAVFCIFALGNAVAKEVSFRLSVWCRSGPCRRVGLYGHLTTLFCDIGADSDRW